MIWEFEKAPCFMREKCTNCIKSKVIKGGKRHYASQQASSEIAAGASKIETPTLGWFTILLVLHWLAHQSGAVVEERVMSINQS